MLHLWSKMIIRQEQFHYIFITQRDHAYVAGEILGQLNKIFVEINQFETVKFALHQFNRGWITPDAHLIINDVNKQPYDFQNYPEKFKLHFCKLSIEQVAQANLYAALLISLYYSYIFADNQSEHVVDFVKRENLRQNYLINKLKIDDIAVINYQLTLMKFCLNLSMYLCINKVGCEKTKEAEIFKRGFEGSELFHKNDKYKIIASYRSKESNFVRFNSLILESDFELEIPSKVVPKQLINEIGMEQAYQKTPITPISVKLIKEPFVWLQ